MFVLASGRAIFSVIKILTYALCCIPILGNRIEIIGSCYIRTTSMIYLVTSGTIRVAERVDISLAAKLLS